MEKEPINTNLVVITGPESTGKTMLAKQLADYYLFTCEPEFARGYIEKLDRKYTYSDVEEIAKMQINQFNRAIQNQKKYIFDTGLIITKVWFDVVYKKCPDWLIEAINQLPVMVHLLCDTDLPWEPDPVRENGGEMREKLFEVYKNELEQFKFPYYIISGIGDSRLKNAIGVLNKFTCL